MIVSADSAIFQIACVECVSASLLNANETKKCATTRMGDTELWMCVCCICEQYVYIFIGCWICSWFRLDFLFRHCDTLCELVFVCEIILCIHMTIAHVSLTAYNSLVFFNCLFISWAWIFCVCVCVVLLFLLSLQRLLFTTHSVCTNTTTSVHSQISFFIVNAEYWKLGW